MRDFLGKYIGKTFHLFEKVCYMKNNNACRPNTTHASSRTKYFRNALLHIYYNISCNGDGRSQPLSAFPQVPGQRTSAIITASSLPP